MVVCVEGFFVCWFSCGGLLGVFCFIAFFVLWFLGYLGIRIRKYNSSWDKSVWIIKLGFFIGLPSECLREHLETGSFV